MNPDLYLRALRFASLAHGDQRMPDGDHPYLVHLASVAAEVIAALEAEPTNDADLAVACALLHDVVEDTATTIDRVEAEFGAAVAAGVLALSKREEVPKVERIADSLARIRQQPREVWMVKLADRVVNLTPPSPRHWSGDKRGAYRAQGEQILAVLEAASPHLAARLRLRIAQFPLE